MHEVLVTDCRAAHPGTFVFGVQWPRHHVMTGPGATSRVDDLLLGEAIRQIGLCMAHRFFEVPLTWRFVARRLGFEWLSLPPPYALAPFEAVAVAEAGPDGSARNALRLSVRFEVAGEPIAHGVGRLRTVAPPVFERLRGRAGARSDTLPRPHCPSVLSPEAVGRRDPFAVVLNRAPTGELTLRVDPANPFFFDHPLDHVPANLAMEAARQVALLTRPGLRPEAISIEFFQFIDLDRPCRLTEAFEDTTFDTIVHVRFEQDGEKAVALVRGATS